MANITFGERKNNKRTILLDGKKFARIHFRKADAMVYIYKCTALDKRKLNTKAAKLRIEVLPNADFMNRENANIIGKVVVHADAKAPYTFNDFEIAQAILDYANIKIEEKPASTKVKATEEQPA